ncbi:hypothetical protein ACPPVQ_17235 [Diaminobutyricibacter sp. McL0618]|uniref:hypothetical protein n=1 Tax=Leifsonia sp. McL0618 TaxID=3415677 RepID=UPI003CF311F5
MPTERLPEFKPMVPATQLPGIVVKRPPVPRTVTLAFWMLLATCAIALASEADVLIVLSRRGLVADSTYLIGGLVPIGIRALLAFAARRGAKFARALLTLIAFISALSLFRAFDPLDIVLVAMVVAAVVLLWVRPSTRYFRAVAAAVAAAKGKELPSR